MMTNTWYNCFSQAWGSELVPDSVSHPAKYAKGLIFRLMRHGLDMSYWKSGDHILDPFNGVGTGGIAAAAHGLLYTGIELNKDFVHITLSNWELYDEQWLLGQCPRPIVIHGNSLRLRDSVRGPFDAVVTSPPYGNRVDDHGSGTNLGGSYGDDAYQIGKVRLGPKYWSAIESILYEIHRVLKPSGILVWVVKGFIKNKEIVDLPQLSLERIALNGFEPAERIDAMLTGEGSQLDIFGNLHIDKNLSQFNRAYYTKYGLFVDRESILIFRRV